MKRAEQALTDLETRMEAQMGPPSKDTDDGDIMLN
jgi:hypothetical protein